MLERFEETFEGHDRYCLYHVPEGPPPEFGWPLVVGFHGGGSTPLDFSQLCQLVRLADRERFVVLFPAGTGPHPDYLTWNAGRCCGHAARREMNDVGYIEFLLDTFLQALPLNGRRIYATGMSNGGMMSYRLAAELPERLAAIAPVAGGVMCDLPTLARPVPAMHIHGTVDEFVPYAGGRGPRSLRRVDFPSVEQSVTTWCEASGITVDPSTLLSETIEPDEFGEKLSCDERLSASMRVFAHDDGVETIVEVTIHGGGHTWPGVAPPLCFLGPTYMGLSASELIWRFFSQHTL